MRGMWTGARKIFSSGKEKLQRSEQVSGFVFLKKARYTGSGCEEIDRRGKRCCPLLQIAPGDSIYRA